MVYMHIGIYMYLWYIFMVYLSYTYTGSYTKSILHERMISDTTQHRKY